MFSTSRQTRARIHLYVTLLLEHIAYSIIMPLIPYICQELHSSDLQLSLAFSGYFITFLLGSVVFGPVTDRYGRKKGLVISLFGLTVGSILCFSTKNINYYLICRVITGFFDNMINLGQAYIADITTLRDRPKYLAQFESMVNFTQCVGPLIAGVLSKFNLYLPLWLSVVLYGIAFVYSLFFLPESVASVIEKNQLMVTFSMVEKNQKERGVSLLDYEESRQIRDNFLKELHEQENERSKNAKLHFNYLMVVAVLCEFFNKWCFSVFDTVVPVYGQRKHELDSFTFSMMSVVGSLINIFQTGWLFNFLLRHGFSIPTITSWGGLTYMLAIVLCLYFDKPIYIIGGATVIVAYGFAAPASAAIMSAECNEAVQGKGIALLSYGGQSAQILSPLVLNNIMTWKMDSPYYVSLVPSCLLFVMMMACNFVPGGKFAGQVSLDDFRGANQNDLEMNDRNEQKEEMH